MNFLNRENYSVLMSIYAKDNPLHIKAAIDSIVNQTYKTNDFVIIIDGPIDRELNVLILEFCELYQEISVFYLEQNMGLGFALNYGVLKCKNELIARMDSDDISYLNRCEIQLNYLLTHPKTTVLGGFMDEFYDIPECITSVKKVPTTYESIYKFGKRRNPVNHPTVMFRKNDILEVGNYSSMRKGQDFELFSRILYNGKIIENLAEPLIKFRANDDMYIRRKQKNVRENYMKIIRKSYENNYISRVDLIISMFYSFILTVIPMFALKLIYRFFLRKKKR